MIARKASVLALSLLAASGSAGCSEPGTGIRPDVYVALLNGANEVQAVSTTATATARVEFSRTGIRWTLTVTSALPEPAIAVHIHSPADSMGIGGVSMNLSPHPTTTLGLLAEGTAIAPTLATLTMDSLKAHIRTGRAYVNIHTATHPNGLIRGHLVLQ
jgi:hypothetical protein